MSSSPYTVHNVTPLNQCSRIFNRQAHNSSHLLPQIPIGRRQGRDVWWKTNSVLRQIFTAVLKLAPNSQISSSALVFRKSWSSVCSLIVLTTNDIIFPIWVSSSQGFLFPHLSTSQFYCSDMCSVMVLSMPVKICLSRLLATNFQGDSPDTYFIVSRFRAKKGQRGTQTNYMWG